MKVVINRCYGGFSLHPLVEVELFEAGWRELGVPVAEYYGKHDRSAEDLRRWREWLTAGADGRPMTLTTFSKDEKFCLALPMGDATRADPRLVEIVERLGEKANGSHAKLRVVEIPDGIEWSINDYDGQESVQEEHREWR